ncbi:hypothetical protein L873DRAFT_1760810 [Choiromyces venosus 120613-1]|uniref:Uncharacterized protein n=1 Tax=Choiromyces venosus 120613-1 TaxID=1336337 RepID=A0A3N4K576_9PEZI|nr:hypothetical protein L873DRAFT_1760810 [Choiromyces venosus 120613-1]
MATPFRLKHLLPRFPNTLTSRPRLHIRPNSTTTPKPSPPPPPPAAKPTRTLPKALQKYASHFRDRPLSHITSFLILHEITAIVPLAGLFLFFHNTRWTPPGLPGEWVVAGVEKFGRYVRRKGWERFKGDEGARLLFEVATAWAVVKALLPVRIGLSLWATPWFARVVLGGVGRVVGRWGRRRAM